MADAAMVAGPVPAPRGSPGGLQRCACGGSCASCREREEEEPLHREEGGAGGGLGEAPPIVHEVLGSSGRRLEGATRAFMEERFGADFGGVRIHTDTKAAASARAVDAHAYTVGDDVVFGEGRYLPGTPSGDRLLAHELAHTLQRTGAARRTLRRRWDSDPECATQPANRWVQTVEVDQASSPSQTVTLNWSDGTSETDIVSTGKGHCCVEPGASASGGTCSAAGSRQNGSNCTPVTQSGGLPIINRYRDHNGVFWWSEIDSTRSIALHEYSPVDGTPLSHGCIRMHHAMAVKLFCGARRNRTIVHIRNLARPMCDHPALRSEWLADFALAATDPLPRDGDTRRQVLEERRALTSAFGRALTPAELSTFGIRDIPRCRIATVEEERSGRAGDRSDPDQVLRLSGFDRRVTSFERALRRVRNRRSAESTVQRHAAGLWQAATARAQGPTANTDDRPLYWARLRMMRALRLWRPPAGIGTDRQRDLLDRFERASRGMDTTTFTTLPGEKRVLVTGFDPFALSGTGIRRGNPSAAAVLFLDGRRLSNKGVTAQIQGVIFPVRFADFDAGLVESVVGPHLTGPQPVDMVMTISQGIGTKFEVEKYAARARGTSAQDNLMLTGGSPGTPTVVPPGVAAGPEFIKTTLPAREMRGAVGRRGSIPGETQVVEIPKGGSTPVTRRGGPTRHSRAVAGSGGSFLSNEIFYRTSLLRLGSNPSIPVGHLHTPELIPSSVGVNDPSYDRARDDIVIVVEKILEAALPAL